MQIITINVTDDQLKLLEVIVSLGYFPNRSELIRIAIRDMLLKQIPIIFQSENITEGIMLRPSKITKKDIDMRKPSARQELIDRMDKIFRKYKEDNKNEPDTSTNRDESG